MRGCIFFLIAGICLLEQTTAQSCSSYTSQSSCNGASGCAWNGANGPCICGTLEPQDVCFLVDESGSVGSTQFYRGVGFVRDTVKSLSASSRVALVEFGTGTKTVYRFSDPQFQSNPPSGKGPWYKVVNNGVDQMTYSNGATWSRQGIDACQSAFVKVSKRGPRLLFMITDGQPFGCVQYKRSGKWHTCCRCTIARQYFSACGPYSSYGSTKTQVQLKNDGIQVFVLGIGSWIKSDKSSFACLTQGKNIISISNYDSTQLNSAKPQAQAFLCPRSLGLRCTEFSFVVSSTSASRRPKFQVGSRARYFELINTHSSWNLKDHQLRIDIEDKHKTRSCYTPNINKVIQKNMYIVVYDPSKEQPKCWNCQCNNGGRLNSAVQCSSAYYLPCLKSDRTTPLSWGTMHARNIEVEVHEVGAPGNEELAECETEYMAYPKNGESLCENKPTDDTECQPNNFVRACQSSGNPGAPNMANCAPPPTPQPTDRPTLRPTARPTKRPTKNPTKRPTLRPTTPPTKKPTKKPTDTPSKKPTRVPTLKPTKGPTRNPTSNPSKNPSKNPTISPTEHPTNNPTKNPSKNPSKNPTIYPTSGPSVRPSKNPTVSPTGNPTISPTNNPSKNPSKFPTVSPTKSPTKFPTKFPTVTPTKNPTGIPTTANPTATPTKNPSVTTPTTSPTTSSPTVTPTKNPSISPTKNPSVSPTISPSKNPSKNPTVSPTVSPTKQPTVSPTVQPTKNPSKNPTKNPTVSPTKHPSANPTKNPSTTPTKKPSVSPSEFPSVGPTDKPTLNPTVSPTKFPTVSPTKNPTVSPSKNPSKFPTVNPTKNPTVSPTKYPTVSPTKEPTISPSVSPTMHPTRCGAGDCQLDGDTTASCSAGQCVCDTTNFYLETSIPPRPSTDGLACLPKQAVPPPQACLVKGNRLSVAVEPNNQTIGSVYDYTCTVNPGGHVYGSVSSTIVGIGNCAGVATCSVSCVTLSPNLADLSILPSSTPVTCTFEPLEAIRTTTPAPTRSHPVIFECSALKHESGGTTSYAVSWQPEADVRTTSYVVAVSTATGCDSVTGVNLVQTLTVGETTNQATNLTYLKTSAPINVASIGNYIVCVGALITGENSITDITYKVPNNTNTSSYATRYECKILTSSPTKPPTNHPSGRPTTTPSKGPSVTPTMTPTFSTPVIHNCTCMMLGYDQITVQGYFDQVKAITLLRVLGEILPGNEVEYTRLSPDPVTGFYSDAPTTSTLPLGFPVPISCIISAAWWPFPNGPIQTPIRQQCAFSSSKPTVSPTKGPSASPSTPNPTVSPTKKPTKSPTTSPTIKVEVPDCEIDFSNGGYTTFTVRLTGTAVVQPLVDVGSVTTTIVATPQSGPAVVIGLVDTGSIVTAVGSGGYTQVFSNLGVSATDTFTVVATLGKGSPGGVLSKVCTVKSDKPTAAPTTTPTRQPTKSPTWEGARATLFDATFCASADLCSCGSVSPCANGFTNRKVEVLTIDEANTPARITFNRNPATPAFPHDVTIEFVITTNVADIGASQGIPDLLTPANVSDLAPKASGGPSPWGTHSVTISGQSSATGEYEFIVVREQNEPVEPTEQFYVAITKCTENRNGQSVFCSVGYPGVFQFNILDKQVGSALTATQAVIIPEYVWLIIAVGVLLVAAMVFMAYRRYRKANTQLAHVQSIEEEIEQLDYEDDPMELNAKHAFMNPLATGVKGNEWGTVDKYLDAEREEARKNIELASVNVEDAVLRQEFAAARPASRQFSADELNAADDYDRQQIQSASSMSNVGSGASANNLAEPLASSAYADPQFDGDMI